jgi:hypothetical protein
MRREIKSVGAGSETVNQFLTTPNPLLKQEGESLMCAIQGFPLLFQEGVGGGKKIRFIHTFIDRAYTQKYTLCRALTLVLLAQDEGPREVQLPNPMGNHTWFIIVALGALLAWCISYALQLQKERLTTKPQRESLLRQKEELLNRLTQLESQKEAGSITSQRYEKEFRKARSRLSDVLSRLGRKPSSPES